MWAPVRKKDASRFSGQDLMTYGEISSCEEMDLSSQTFFSPKEILLPVRETMFKVEGDSLLEEPFGEKPVLAFLRACDIHAVKVMDAHFLSGPAPDMYYQRRRSNLKIVLIECPEPFEHCYCLSMGTARPPQDHAAFLRLHRGRQEWVVHDKSLIPFFPYKVRPVPAFRPVPFNHRKVRVPAEVPGTVFTHDLWKEYSRRCIACGRCNTSCPTCTCFSIWDVSTEEGQARQRIWSACHVKKFALLAGNHDFRTQNGERMRYKVLHKIQDFRKRTGLQMCIGCGRCDLVCPEYISMFRSLDKINAALKENPPHGA
jgi:anaerobic sulfite reductase subunit A